MSSQRCPRCSLVTWVQALVCKRCGFKFEQAEDPMLEPVVQMDELRMAIDPAAQMQGSGFGEELGHVYPNQNWNEHHHYRPQYVAPENGEKKQGMAIASLVLGLIGIAPVGLILGIIAFRKAKKYPREYTGKSFAIAGIALNGVGMVLVIPFIAIIAAIAVPNLLAARKSANEASAISSLRMISSAQSKYLASSGTSNCLDLAALAQSNAIDSVLASGRKHGYNFILARTPGGCEIHATPTDTQGATASGNRSFLTSSQDGWLIHASANSGAPIDINAPALDMPPGQYAQPTTYPQTASSDPGKQK